MSSLRASILTALVGLAVVAIPSTPAAAQTAQNTYIAGDGNESITNKHLLNGVLVGTNNATHSAAELLSAFTVMGSNNAIDTAGIVFGNNNSQSSPTPGLASGSLQVGRGNTVEGESNTQLGQNNTTTGSTNATIGTGNEIEGNQNLLTGILVTTKGSGNAITGWGGQVIGDNNAHMGTGGSISGNNNVTMGNSVEVTGNNQVVGGTSARGFADGCVALGSGSQCSESDEFSVGLTNNERRVTNVGDGRNYTDAANVRQVAAAVRTLGAGADIVSGQLVEPVYQFLSGATYTNVAEAMYDLDGRIASLSQNPGGTAGPQGPQGPQGPAGKDGVGGSDVKAGANVVVTTDEDGTKTVAVSDNVQLSDQGSVQVGKTTVNAQGVTVQGGPSVTTAGVNAGNQRVTGVAPGRIEQGSTDAVNGGQVYEMQQVWDDRWTDTDRRLRHQDRRINGLSAQLGAMSQMATAAAQNGGTAVGQVNLNVGVGFSGGSAAMAVGWGARVSEKVSVSAGLSFGSGNKPVAGFGLSINLGR
ncbi:YadA-like family protein [Stenotrophomonas maltophilia]|uniref:YadA-like family protein n=1 Tax=Stenotrophomonas maltophilia TaxID=40324 RepID=UPI000AE6DAA8|nr:YadA-like family protein [Stenotrophomonas maltophilia]EKT4099857.1 YadA-like family protein [Stenotrophomonas maltophilia]MBH1667398.1 YadA-like family protein [Stenotrophomonas maltophilia]MBH1829993.1 YadA-like family protein [Stenotrophomonas maltophilia]